MWKTIAVTLLLAISSFAVTYPCHLKSDISLVPPYNVAYCYNAEGRILWGTGFTPLNRMVYVLPKTGDIWYVSPRTREKFAACDGKRHCFILHVTASHISGEYLGVEFWGTAWQ